MYITQKKESVVFYVVMSKRPLVASPLFSVNILIGYCSSRWHGSSGPEPKGIKTPGVLFILKHVKCENIVGGVVKKIEHLTPKRLPKLVFLVTFVNLVA